MKGRTDLQGPDRGLLERICGREIPALTILEAVASVWFATTLALGRAGYGMIGIEFGSQGGEHRFFFCIDEGAVHPSELVDRIQENQRPVAARLAGPTAHAVCEAHHRLNRR